jgi:hypothetical protein
MMILLLLGVFAAARPLGADDGPRAPEERPTAAPADPPAEAPAEPPAEAPAEPPAEAAPPEAPLDPTPPTTETIPPANPPTLSDAQLTPPGRPKKPYVWHGIGLPYVTYNTTDKLGFGVGAELYDRKRGESFGYRYRLSLSTMWTTSGNYGSNYLQLERRGEHFWVMRLTWRLWRNMVYVGAGGDEVLLDNGDQGYGNTVNGPSYMVNVIRKVRGTPLYVFVQGYARYTMVGVEPGGLLDQRRPFGSNNGLYFDAGGGLYVQEVDRWPMPNKGVRAELSVRAGGTASEGRFEPLLGTNLEVITWWPVFGEWLVIGHRTLIDKTFGVRPFWEQEFLGGTLRDETAYEQMLTGYARSRSRGDGVIASMIEVRPKFGETNHPVVDIGFYASAFVEAGWLFKGNDPGPFLPTVGVAPLFLWQGAIELRPFLAWGWWADTQGGQRTPRTQFGISLLSAL